MDVYHLDRAARRLQSLRERRNARLVLAVVAAPAGALLLASLKWLGSGLLAGAALLLLLALVNQLSRHLLISRLALYSDAYRVPEVERYGAALVEPAKRRVQADSLVRVIEN